MHNHAYKSNQYQKRRGHHVRLMHLWYNLRATYLRRTSQRRHQAYQTQPYPSHLSYFRVTQSHFKWHHQVQPGRPVPSLPSALHHPFYHRVTPCHSRLLRITHLHRFKLRREQLLYFRQHRSALRRVKVHQFLLHKCPQGSNACCPVLTRATYFRRHFQRRHQAYQSQSFLSRLHHFRSSHSHFQSHPEVQPHFFTGSTLVRYLETT
jgi:hypothetical protein